MRDEDNQTGGARAAKPTSEERIDVRIGTVTLNITQPATSTPAPPVPVIVAAAKPEPATSPADQATGRSASLSRYYLRW
jgi:hypothetical protein